MMLVVTKKKRDTMDPLTKVAAGNVKRLRDQAGLSQDELARASDLHKNTINRFETGKQTIELDTLHDIADALNAVARSRGDAGVSYEDLVRAPQGTVPTSKALVDYMASPWAQIDAPVTEAELHELARPELAHWLGDVADAEAVHHILMALRRRHKT